MDTQLSANLDAKTLAKKILAEVMSFRRIPRSSEPCGDSNCPKCCALFLPKIVASVEQNEPVTFVLPAFPGKSPNLEKVLGVLPDYAERLALNFLGNLCQKIKQFYPPGIKMIICSDGRVFSDVIGMKESDVTQYQIELDRLIKEMSLDDISTFNLDHYYNDVDFDEMRIELMKRYGKPLKSLKEKIRGGKKPTASPEEQEALRMYCGITRFLFEDSIKPGQTKSRTLIQKEARANACEVIRKSNAWGELIAEYFPKAVRLSIHPQTCGSKKLGIRLVGNESWMTPWHGVAVETEEGFVLLKRSEAEDLGGEIVYSDAGHPSHYTLKKTAMSITRSRRLRVYRMEEETTNYKITHLKPFGVLVEPWEDSVSVGDLDVESLRKLFNEEHLVLLRGFETFSSSEEFSNYCESWGEVSVWPFGKVLELIQQDNPQDHIFDSSYVPLHWDGMYRPQVPEYQIFHCVKAPLAGKGGRTTFSNTILVLDHSSPELKRLWDKVTGTYQRKMEFYHSKVVSPVVTKHPLQDYSVIRYMEPHEGENFINPPDLQYTGISDEELQEFHHTIKEELYNPRNFYAHEWQDGDIVIADNFTLLHGREAFASKSPRHIRRVQVLSNPPYQNPNLETYK